LEKFATRGNTEKHAWVLSSKQPNLASISAAILSRFINTVIFLQFAYFNINKKMNQDDINTAREALLQVADRLRVIQRQSVQSGGWYRYSFI
jgi:uncharacterized protein YggT (Ycf19 family)